MCVWGISQEDIIFTRFESFSKRSLRRTINRSKSNTSLLIEALNKAKNSPMKLMERSPSKSLDQISSASVGIHYFPKSNSLKSVHPIH